MRKVLFITLLSFFSVSMVLAQKGDTLTTDSGLKYVQVKAGKGDTPRKGQRVKMKYAGRLTNGDLFDSGTFEFKIGAKEVIPGWDEGVMLMKEGEKGVLVVPYQLGYGEKGYPEAGIPQKATLIFEVKLLKIR